MARKKVISIYDDEFDIPEVLQNTWATVLKGCNWKPTDGAVEGVFNNKSLGYRCVWSTNWATAAGPLRPDSYAVLEYMATDAMMAEAQDVAYRISGDYVANQLGKLLVEHQTPGVNLGYWQTQLVRWLREARQGYTDFVAFWAMPRKGVYAFPLEMLNVRPDWGERDDYKALVEQNYLDDLATKEV